MFPSAGFDERDDVVDGDAVVAAAADAAATVDATSLFAELLPEDGVVVAADLVGFGAGDHEVALGSVVLNSSDGSPASASLPASLLVSGSREADAVGAPSVGDADCFPAASGSGSRWAMVGSEAG